MTTYALQPALPLAADGAALSRVLQRAGVTKTSVVRVTGPAGLAAIFWLSRHGYDRAAYVHPNRVATMDPVDALLVPHACQAQALTDLIQGGGCLREGGVLIVQAPPAGLVGVNDSVPAVLEPLGYAVEQPLSDKGRDIYIARRRGYGFKTAA
jgi:hypothetical protein